MAVEGWKNYGLVKVPGLPATTGPYAVGCLDLMHEGLLVRLYYPAEKERIANHDYGKYSFRSCYRKAFMDALEMKFTGIIAGTVNFLTGETSFRC